MLGQTRMADITPLRPVCITRETRRVPALQLVWPDETRVLFVVASPAGQEPVPEPAHLLAMSLPRWPPVKPPWPAP